MAGINIGTAFLQIVPSVQGINDSASRDLERQGGGIGDTVGKAFAIAAGAAIAASAAIGAGLKKAYDVGSIFDDISDTIRVGTGATGDALAGMEDVAKRIGGTIPVEFGKVGGTVADLNTRMGLTGENLETVAKQFLQAGNILGQDVDINSATKAFSAFGVGADDVSAQMDNLFRVSQATGVGMNELTSAATAQAPALQELGFGFTDVIGLIGSLDKAGLDSAAVTKSMGKGLVELAKDGEQPAQAFQRITGDLTSLVSQGKNAEAIDLASGIFGTKGATQFVAAVQSGTLNMGDLMAATGATGDTILGLGEETADAAENWTLFKNKAIAAFEPIGSAVFGLVGTLTGRLVDAFDPAMAQAQGFWNVLSGKDDAVDDGPFLQFAQMAGERIRGDLVPAAKDFWQGLSQGFDSGSLGILGTIGATVNETFGQIFDTLGQAWAEIGPPLMEAFKTIWEAVKPLIPTFLQLFQAFNPVGLLFKALLPVLPQLAGIVGDLAKVLADGVARALQAVAPLFQTVVDVINRLLPFVTKLVASLLPPLVSLFDKVAPLLDAILDALMPVVDAIVAALIPAIDAIMPIVERVFTFIADTIGNVVAVLGGVIDFVTGVFTGDWSRAWDGVKQIFGAIWDQVKNIFSTLWDVIVSFFTNIGPQLWAIVTGLAGQLVEWGGQFLGWIWQGIQDLWTGTVWPWFQGLPALAWSGIQAFAGQMVTWGGEFLSWLWAGISGFWTGTVWPWVSNLPQTIWDGITSFAGDAVGWMAARGSEFLGWMWSGIQAKFEEVKNWFIGLPGMIWDAAKGAFSAAVEWGGQLMAYLVQGISGSDPYVSAELARTLIDAANAVVPGLGELVDLTGVDLDKNIDDYLASLSAGRNIQNATLNAFGGIFGRAQGGLFGPYYGHEGGQITVGTHGTADDVLIRGSKNEFMVNERATSMWLPVLEWINDGAVPGFAGGGLLGSVGSLLGAGLVKSVLPGLMKKLADSVTSAIGSGAAGGTANSSYDPSSFGWQQASNIVPFSWNGAPVVGGVAGGTQGLWTSLLNALVPQIPGGLTSPIWGYENRTIAGTSTPSFHSFGLAIDVNAPANGRGLPGYGRSGIGVIPGDLAHSLAAQLGMQWGGDWDYTDPMHFEIHLSPDQVGGGGSAASVAAGGVAGALAKLFGGLMGAGNVAYSPSAGVEQWRGIVNQALAITSQPLSFADIVLHQMDTESSGNPNAQNNSDANAARGTPSKSLMQVIDPTFEAYALPPYDKNIWDPLSNVIASIRYVLARYGSIPNGMQGHAYDGGGLFPGGSVGFNFLREPEAVLTPPQTEAYQAVASALESGDLGGSGLPMLNVERMEILRGTPEDIVDEMLWRARVSV